jgi:hypothetical protein
MSKKQEPADRIFTTASGAGLLIGLTGASITRYAREGRIPCQQIGGQGLRVYKVADVRRLGKELARAKARRTRARNERAAVKKAGK